MVCPYNVYLMIKTGSSVVQARQAERVVRQMYPQPAPQTPQGPARVSQDIVCAVCESGKAAAKLLLCDGYGCDVAQHTFCCLPRLRKVPEGEWYCHSCAPPPPEGNPPEEVNNSQPPAPLRRLVRGSELAVEGGGEAPEEQVLTAPAPAAECIRLPTGLRRPPKPSNRRLRSLRAWGAYRPHWLFLTTSKSLIRKRGRK